MPLGAFQSIAAGGANEVGVSSSMLVFGIGNEAWGQVGSFIAGGHNKLWGEMENSSGNILLGSYNVVNGTLDGIYGSVLIGRSNTCEESEAWVLGRGNIAKTGCLTVGEYATVQANAAFVIGNGTGVNARSNALVVGKNGTVTIPGGQLVLGSDPVLSSSGTNAAITSQLNGGGYLKRQIGDLAFASPGALLAWGEGSLAEADRSVAIGKDATAVGDDSLALGKDSEVGEFGTGSVALAGGLAEGSRVIAASGGTGYGDHSVAMARGTATGDGALAIGGVDPLHLNWPGNQALGEVSSAIGGIGNRSAGVGSFASGYWTVAASAHSVALGSLNLGNGSSTSEWVDGDPLFELGNGYAERGATEPSTTVRSNAITTLKEGRTTLTNRHWDTQEPLGVPQESAAEALVVEGHTVLKGRVLLEQAQGDIYMGIYGD
ncbi:hypothetical protein [Luteolibacter sp. Populi]|uniref:hypothetical protein n=1 Tax=Luteolibacter sp. Populi TaxID=3230487 RepID=UPI0034660669